MPWLTGNWMNQSIPGLESIYRPANPQEQMMPAPAASPSAPAGGDYWSQLGSLLGFGPAPQQTPYWAGHQQQQQMLYNQIPGTSFSIAGAGDYMARMRQAQAQQQQAPSNMYGNMPMVAPPSQQFRPGSNQGSRNSRPLLRADGSEIDAQAYLRGDRPGMSTPVGGNRPQLAPPNRPARQPKRPSATFGQPTDRGGVTRANIPGFSNFVY